MGNFSALECGQNDISTIIDFKKYNITSKITKIYTNINSQCIFWQTEDNSIYGHGINTNGQLGQGEIDVYPHSKPILIASLQNHMVIDIKSNDICSIALCKGGSNHIVSGYCLKNVPSEILNIIHRFCYVNAFINRVMMTIDGKWVYLPRVSQGNIIKIDCEANYLYLLQANQKLYRYVATRNGYGQIDDFILDNTTILVDPNVIDFSCADSTIVIIKNNGCAVSKNYTYNIHRDIHLKLFGVSIKAKSVMCGYDHYLVIAENGDYYMWGSNNNMECLTASSQHQHIDWGGLTAARVILSKDAEMIQSISLGFRNTKVLMKRPIYYRFSKDKREDVSHPVSLRIM